MSNDLVLLGIIFLLLNDGTISTTQALLLLALASTTRFDFDRDDRDDRRCGRRDRRDSITN